jgi:hypothetical protein
VDLRQHDLSFANFVLRFGPDEVLLDYAKDIVLPAFTRDTHVRSYGETSLYLYDVKFTQVDDEDGFPVLALSGHFVKDTVLRRQQVFRRDRGLVEDQRSMESAPSSFFVLILNNHRLLYFAETAAAPSLDTFRTTVELFLRREWHEHLKRRYEYVNVTDRVTMKELRRRIPPPVLAIVPVAGEDAIAETITRFGLIKEVRFKLIEPNDELDASVAVAAVEENFRPLAPSRLEIVAARAKGLNKEETARAITEASEGHNTQILVTGEDEDGIKMKADNDEFALSVPIEDPPPDDSGLRGRLVETYNDLVAAAKVRRIPTPARVREKLGQLFDLL